MLSVMRWIGAACVAAVVAGCGGGGGDKNCSDFAYQQDAQAWHNSHSNSDLDADHDGIACESLPSRPASGAGGGAGTSTTLPNVMVFDLSGQVASITKMLGNYSRTSLTVDGRGSATLTGNLYSDGRFGLSNGASQEYLLDYGGPEGYPGQNMLAREPAYAWPSDKAVSVRTSGQSGLYSFMGKRCLASSCTMTYGQFLVDSASATVSVCQGGPLSGCGANTQTYSFTSSFPEDGLPGVFRLRSRDGSTTGFIAYGTVEQGAIGISVVSQDGSAARISAFAGKATLTYRITDSPSGPYHAINASGTAMSTNAAGLSSGGVVNDQPLPGFFRLNSNAAALNMLSVAPARVLAYDGTKFILWLN